MGSGWYITPGMLGIGIDGCRRESGGAGQRSWCIEILSIYHGVHARRGPANRAMNCALRDHGRGQQTGAPAPRDLGRASPPLLGVRIRDYPTHAALSARWPRFPTSARQLLSRPFRPRWFRARRPQSRRRISAAGRKSPGSFSEQVPGGSGSRVTADDAGHSGSSGGTCCLRVKIS